MLDHLFETIRRVLLPRWNARLPVIQREAARLEPGISPLEAYQEGYRRAYWDALVDAAEADLLRREDPVPMPTSLTRLPTHAEDTIN